MIFSLGRYYKKVANRRNYEVAQVVAAVRAVRSGMSLRNAERQFGVPARTIGRKTVIARRGGDPAEIVNGGYQPVFTKEQEGLLTDYLIQANNTLLGLSRGELRSLAFDYANRLDLHHPFNKKMERAGYEWVLNFFKRNPGISFRFPQSVSIYRAKAFTRKKIEPFYNNLESVMKAKVFTPAQIYNVDETGFSIVSKPLPVVAKKGSKFVGRITSAERGRTLTAICCCSADGVFVPPFLIFPGKKFDSRLLDSAPKYSIGTATPSGWSNQDSFVRWLTHFIKFATPSHENPAIIILDNHTSHVSYDAIKLCMDNSVTMITLPPHSSHKMQPLDVGVFASFKTALRTAQHMWLSRHSPQRITESVLPQLFSVAYEASARKENATSGFRKAGIVPFNPYIFTDEDFSTEATFGDVEGTDETDEVTPDLADPPQIVDDQSNKSLDLQDKDVDCEEEHVYIESTDEENANVLTSSAAVSIDKSQCDEQCSVTIPLDDDSESNQPIAVPCSSGSIIQSPESTSVEATKRKLLELEHEIIQEEEELIRREKELLQRKKLYLMQMKTASSLETPGENAVAHSSQTKRKRILTKQNLVYFSDINLGQVTPHSLRPIASSSRNVSARKPRAAGKSQILTTEAVRRKLFAKKEHAESKKKLSRDANKN